MIGLMGGTFSPIHFGHLLMCERVREEFHLSKIIFMPAKKPPHKDNTQVVEAYDRLEMVRLAIEDNPYFEVSDLEMNREGASFTVDTLKALKETLGVHQKLGLIVGADSLVQFYTWKSYQEIINMATLIVASRPDTDETWLDDTISALVAQEGATVLKSSAKALNYTSTEIRENVRNGLSIHYLVPLQVEAYILEKGLYR